MSNGIGIGIVGLGWISQKVYLPFFLKHDAVTKLAVYDIDNSKLIEDQSQMKIKTTKTYQELLDDRDIVAVWIATPNYLHCEQIIAALTAGKIVFCDKPVCIGEEQIQQLKQAITQYPDRLFPLLPNRFREDLKCIKYLLDNQTIGSIYKVKAHWLRDKGIPGSTWFLDSSKSGGGVLVDLGAHLLDILYWLCHPDHLVKISARKSSNFLSSDRIANWHNERMPLLSTNVEDDISVFTVFNKMSWSVDLCWAGYIGQDETCIEIFGEKGTIKYKGLFGFSTNTEEECSTIIVRTNELQKSFAFNLNDRVSPYYSMLEECLEIVKGTKRSSFKAEEALDTMVLIGLIYECSLINDLKERIENESCRFKS